MEKVTRIREELGFKRRSVSQQRIGGGGGYRGKPVTVVECQRRVAIPDRVVMRRTNKDSNIFRSASTSHYRQQSAGAKIVQNPQSLTDRAVNFLIK